MYYDNVTDAEKGPSGTGAALLDELVPPVRPWRHRIVSVAAILLAVIATWSATAGWIVPRTEGPELRQWGGAGPVYAVVHVSNGSPRSIEVTGLGAAPDGVSVLGYTTAPAEQWEDTMPQIEDGALPLRLAPGEGTDIAVVYRIDDCAATSQAGDPPSVNVRFAGISGVWTHTRETPWHHGSRSWPAALTEFACPR